MPLREGDQQELGRVPAEELILVAPSVERLGPRARAVRRDPRTPPTNRVAVSVHQELEGPGIAGVQIVATEPDLAPASCAEFGRPGAVVPVLASGRAIPNGVGITREGGGIDGHTAGLRQAGEFSAEFAKGQGHNDHLLRTRSPGPPDRLAGRGPVDAGRDKPGNGQRPWRMVCGR